MNPVVPDTSPPAVSADPQAAANGGAWDEDVAAVLPNLDELITEDGAAVDNVFNEKQMRLLTEPLYVCWAGPGEGQSFVAMANVAWFYSNKKPAVVPDALLSVDVEPVADVRTKEGRSYFQWLRGKPPDVIIEIVSDRRGGEETHKMRLCARQGVPIYVIFDPANRLGGGVLRAFALDAVSGQYQPTDPSYFPKVGLGLKLWTGVFEGQHQTWLRWCDANGRLIPTGEEEHQRAEQERHRAEEERRRAEEAAAKAERLAAQLRALGIEPQP
jgi:Uma2 family endonuclease